MRSKSWLKFSLINLFIVAALGLLMRYKIGFEFPVFEQKYIQFSHYHFAFYGWIAHTLMVLMVRCLERSEDHFNFKKYTPIFAGNLISSYGMLLSFLFLGFGAVSVIFTVGAILSGYLFTAVFVRDLNRCAVNTISARWFKAALVFNFLSTLGVFYLAYMMLATHMHQNAYLSTSYYFLHFQYNGWFFFACMGLLVNSLDARGPLQSKIFWLFACSCVPAYFLSVLWMKLPLWLYAAVVISALLQVYALILFLGWLMKFKPSAIKNQPFILRYILLFVAVALTIKLMLQLGSTIPVVSKLAFGFRPVVIAYLHLVLLAIITLYLLYYLYAEKIFASTKNALISLLIFSVGVALNEIVLAVQGIGAFTYTVIPMVNEILFAVAVVLVVGIGMVCYFSLSGKEISKYD